MQVDVTAVNDAPTVTAGAILNYTEGDPATVIDPTVTIADVDDTMLESATIQITGNLQAGSDFLTATLGGGITGSTWVPSTGTYTLTGSATVSQYQLVLRTVTFHNSSDTPSPLDRTITWTVNDGNANSAARTSTVQINTVNDAPTVTPISNQTIPEDGTTGALAFTVNDVETAAGSLTVTATSSNTTIIPNGNLTLTDLGSGNWTIEATPALNQNGGPVTVTVTVDDGITSTDETFDVTVAASNDEQFVATNSGLTVGDLNEGDTAVVITQAMLETTDIDNTPAQLQYTLTGVPNNGTLRLGGTALLNGAQFFQSDINAGLLTFDHNDSEVFTDSFTFTVDDGTGTVSGATFNIAINPINDNDPVITSNGGTANAAISIAENSTAVTTVTATDSDLPAQALSYAIVGGTDMARFNIASGSGVLTFAAAPDFEAATDSNTNNIYEVIVQVSDGAGRTDTQTIQVTVTDVDEFDVTPIVDNDAATNQVNENAAPGTILGITAFSNDLDGSSNSITYSLDNDAGGLFQIDNSTGVVSTLGAIDFETTGSTLNIVVRATSDDTSSTTTGFTINVSDVNEFNPVVNDQTLAVAENSANSTSVGLVAASDADTAQTLTYSITAGNTNNAFAINSATGEITVNDQNELDRETTPQYTLTVQVTDSLAPTRSDTASITIDVTNVNEAPVINLAGPFALDENAVSGTVVGGTSSTDVDAGDTATYSITAGNTGGAFSINSSTGQITIANAGALDFETLSTFNVTVQVADAGGLTDTTTVNVNINDINEAPTDLSLIGNSVSENVANGTAVGSVTGTDVDAGDTLTYSLTNSAGGRFAIDLNSGQITVANGTLLNFEAAAAHGITVQTTDAAGLQYNEAFTIHVNDVNEAPVAVDDSVTAQQTQTLNYDTSTVLINDTDIDGDPLTAVLVAGPANGTLTLNADGTFDYTPTGTYYGTDTFAYYATDGTLVSNTVTVTIDVQAIGGGSTGTGSSTDSGTDTVDSATDDSDSGDSTPTDLTPPVTETADTPTTTEAGNPQNIGESEPLSEAAPNEMATIIADSVGAEAEGLIGEFITSVNLDRVPDSYWNAARGSSRIVLNGVAGTLRPGISTVFGGLIQTGPAFTDMFLDFGNTNDGYDPANTIENMKFDDQLVIGSSVAVSTSVSVGYVVWMLRGGSLLTTFMSSLPAWQSFDPLPILERSAGDGLDEDDESLESIASGSSSKSHTS